MIINLGHISKWFDGLHLLEPFKFIFNPRPLVLCHNALYNFFLRSA